MKGLLRWFGQRVKDVADRDSGSGTDYNDSSLVDVKRLFIELG